jgi:non-ribosomal peptide synthetase component F
MSGMSQQELDEVIGSERGIEDIYVLSPLQQGLLFHSLYEPGSGECFVQSCWALQGDLNVSALEQACRMLVKRHTSLRTSFLTSANREPLQIVWQNVNLPWEQQDWRTLSQESQAARLGAYLRDDRRRGFDLSKAPLMRCLLIRVSESCYWLVWSFHHLLLDGWSVALLRREVFDLYKPICRGVTPGLEPARPYRAYIEWLQKQHLSGSELYWRNVLSGFTSATRLGPDGGPGDTSASVGECGEWQVRLPAQLTEQLQTLSRQHKITPNTILEGVWALLLSCYSGDQDVMFGTIVSGRTSELPGVESIVGLFINTLPVRVRILPDTLLLPWLRNMQEQQVEMRQYEYSPLTRLQGWSDVPKGEPIFETILAFENYPVEASAREEIQDLVVNRIRSIETTNFPLTIIVVPGNEWTIWAYYNPSRFGEKIVAQILKHFERLLERIAADPHVPLQHLIAFMEDQDQQINLPQELQPSYESELFAL